MRRPVVCALAWCVMLLACESRPPANLDTSSHYAASKMVGDLGAVVETYGADGLDVEFVQASGHTKALVTPKASDLRPVADRDILAVRAS